MFYLKSVPKAVLSTIDKGKSSHVRFFWKSRVPYWTTDFNSSSFEHPFHTRRISIHAYER